MINDTIAAISTALGEGGIGIIRVSGKEAYPLVDNIFISKSVDKLSDCNSHTINYGFIVDPETGEKVDQVLVSVMKAPKTFTGEDIVEINCHGGIVPLKKVLNLTLLAGARLAEPGEFSKRAFLNGKIDLAQAESIIDLIRAKTDLSLKVAMGQLQGALSENVEKIRRKLLEVLAYIEADIDFPDEDIDGLTSEEITKRAQEIYTDVEFLIKSSETGKILKEGLKTVIVGRPNVGKSSLLNALLREKRAIVTEIPGTTRDVIEELLNLGGIPLKIVDTAGIRETEDLVEKIGVEKSKELFGQADLILFLIDAQLGFTEEDAKIASMLTNQKIIVIVNKMDLVKNLENVEMPEVLQDKKVLKLSVTKLEGIDLLEETIKEMVFQGQVQISDSSLVVNVRHKDVLSKVKKHIEGVIQSSELGMPTDCLSIDLKGAWELLGEITGDTVGEDILDQIFSQFCIGK